MFLPALEELVIFYTLHPMGCFYLSCYVSSSLRAFDLQQAQQFEQTFFASDNSSQQMHSNTPSQRTGKGTCLSNILLQLRDFQEAQTGWHIIDNPAGQTPERSSHLSRVFTTCRLIKGPAQKVLLVSLIANSYRCIVGYVFVTCMLQTAYIYQTAAVFWSW